MKRYLALLASLPLLSLSCGIIGGGLDAYVTGRTGQVQVFRKGGDSWVDLDTNDVVGWEDTVRIGRNGFLELTFDDTNVVRLDENTKVHWADVVDSAGDRVLEVYNHHGRVLSQINALGKPFDAYRVRTPQSVAYAKGTYFCVTYQLHAREAEVVVVTGEVIVVYPEVAPEPVSVTPGHYVVVPWHKPPRSPKRVSRARWRPVERVMRPPMPLLRPRARFGGRRTPAVKRVHTRPARPVAKPKVSKPRRRPAGGAISKARPARPPRAVKSRKGVGPKPASRRRAKAPAVRAKPRISAKRPSARRPARTAAPAKRRPGKRTAVVKKRGGKSGPAGKKGKQDDKKKKRRRPGGPGGFGR